MAEVTSPITVHAAGHFHYRHSWTTDRPNPHDHLLIWAVGGSMDVTVGGESSPAAPGDLVLLPPGIAHRYRPTSDDWEWLWLHCDGAAVPGWWRMLCPDGRSWPRLGQDAAVRSRFVELVTAAATAGLQLTERGAPQGRTDRTDPDDPDPVTRLRVDSCAHSLIGLVAARLHARSGRPGAGIAIADLTEWILDHLADPLTVATLAAETGWSPPHLHRLVREQWGTTPMRLVTRLRMDRAERLLRDTDLTVARIATLVGFADPLHFSRRFRETTGRPPSAVRTWSAAPGRRAPGDASAT